MDELVELIIGRLPGLRARPAGLWREKLTTDGRQTLRELLDGPIRFTPTGRQYQFDADVTTWKQIAGLVGTPTFVASREEARLVTFLSSGRPA
jgi:hypothetical protein